MCPGMFPSFLVPGFGWGHTHHRKARPSRGDSGVARYRNTSNQDDDAISLYFMDVDDDSDTGIEVKEECIKDVLSENENCEKEGLLSMDSTRQKSLKVKDHKPSLKVKDNEPSPLENLDSPPVPVSPPPVTPKVSWSRESSHRWTENVRCAAHRWKGKTDAAKFGSVDVSCFFLKSMILCWN